MDSAAPGRAGIARVALDTAIRKEFDYEIPAEFADRVEVGARVKVPFGTRQLLGSVTALVKESPHSNLRPILKVIGPAPLFTPNILKLARWIAEYYCCPLETVLKTALPESVRKEEEGYRERLMVRATKAGERPALTKRQAQILEAVESADGIFLQELIDQTRTTAATIRKLESVGLVTIAPAISERDPYAHEQILPTQPLPLNAEQERALRTVKTAMDACASETFLLHGVTGSGKTEVYLQGIAHALQAGKGAIVLVPEISLTPQTVERFKARFSSGTLQTLVAVLHSHLSAGERHDEWQKIRQGRARIVIGARSAIFAPVEPLGLIVVDEEHEHSYKQEESPRYNARDVATLRGRYENAVVLLGSATPSMESFHNAESGKYKLLEMPTRADDKKMPVVRVVDLRDEARKVEKGGVAVFSQRLRDAISLRLERKEQTILFLNRRGYASSLQCPKCGYVAGCPNCSIALTYHRHIQQLRCHICGHQQSAPTSCPEATCRNPGIRFAGLGTERVEETLRKLFPHARVARMDSDTLKRKDDYRRILGDFRTGKLDIIVGTQMIAKGLHFPNVTLVGIIWADLSLHMPDFRAGERTFQLLTQVAGRAGRGDVEGEVIVQSFTPFHPAIQYARRHDYAGFYEQEIEFRQQLKYPPAARAAIITVKSRNEEKVAMSAEHIKTVLEKGLASIADLVVAGPAPAPLFKAESFFRHQLMLRTKHMTKASRLIAAALSEVRLPDDVTMVVDIDPMNLA
jgi:primosomal protein N' (replication factor Y) (superfamily II helicase)